LGWRSFFVSQLTLDELDRLTPARVSEQHRSQIAYLGEQCQGRLDITPRMLGLAVGDWLLVDDNCQFVRALDRETVFQRKAPGTGNQIQTMVANVDTVFVVTSLNEDFNLNRIERYLAVCHEAGSYPVVVLTKADLCNDPTEYTRAVLGLDPGLMVEVVNALDPDTLGGVRGWCGVGQTVALLGSSGVGKSTLLNGLLGESRQLTGGIREQDDKGRHTTTGRSLHVIEGGGVILDTPGMRELQLGGGDTGVEATFADIAALANHCRFGDCSHSGEPGCAVLAAIESGELDPRRLSSHDKLRREEARNKATLAEQRAHGRSLGKLYRSIQKSKRHEKGR
jgi:ribosome biogenesis GTPase